MRIALQQAGKLGLGQPHLFQHLEHALAPQPGSELGAWICRPSPTISSTVMRGDSEENGS
jgi:hypothetical protein